MEREVVPIDKLTVTREPHARDEHGTKQLAASMKRHIDDLILVNEDYEVIDGARQLEVLREWGRTEVEVNVSSRLDDSLEALTARHEHDYPDGVRAPFSARRGWDVRTSLDKQRYAYWIESRRLGGERKKQGLGSIRNLPFAERLARALGMPKKAKMLEDTFSLFISAYDIREAIASRPRERTPEEAEFAKELIHQLDTDLSLSIYAAHRRWATFRYTGSKAQPRKAAEQRALISKATAMIGGITPALTSIGHLAGGHDMEDIVLWRRTVQRGLVALKALHSELRSYEGISGS